MKRLVLWITSLVLLMLASAVTALPTDLQPRALNATETDAITAGACTTCNNPYPYIEYEGWQLIGKRTSAHTYLSRSSVREYPNRSAITDAVYSLTYDDQCRRVWTGGSATLGRSLGISFNTTLHCAEKTNLTFSVPPLSKVTLYQGYKRYYVTYTYRHYLQWSDGYREFSGLTETIREEKTYYYQEIQ